MKNESVSALFTNKLDTLGADPRRRNWPRVLFMRWPRERGHVSLANFQVSDDIVGRSLGQIGGKERETERERQREREFTSRRLFTERWEEPVLHRRYRKICPLPFSRNETRQARRVCSPPLRRWIKFQRNYGGLRFFRGIIGEDFTKEPRVARNDDVRWLLDRLTSLRTSVNILSIPTVSNVFPSAMNIIPLLLRRNCKIIILPYEWECRKFLRKLSLSRGMLVGWRTKRSFSIKM